MSLFLKPKVQEAKLPFKVAEPREDDWVYPPKLNVSLEDHKNTHPTDTSVKQIFNEECHHLVFDAAFVKRLIAYNLKWRQKNQDHILFLGGNLTGVHVVRFTDDDRNIWFNDILEVDEIALEDRLTHLSTINTDYFVSGDTMNLSCVWATHMLYASTKLSDKQKHEGMMAVMLIMNYKFLTSRLYQHFRYPADRATAEATYAQLSYKFSLKALGSWDAVLNERAEDLISKTSIHHEVIEKMDDDKEIVYMLNDAQGRIRAMLKKIYGEFDRIHKSGVRISSTSSTVEHDGALILKDQSKATSEYTRYINAVISDQASFIRPELTTIVEKMMHTMPPKLFQESLVWMSVNYRQRGADVIEEVLEEILLQCFDYLRHNRDVIRNPHDLPGILSRLRGTMMSSRSTDPELMALRDKLETIVVKATDNKNESLIASVRTGLFLYIILRTLTMHHYNSV